MSIWFNIFEDEEGFFKFVENSVLQYIKLKFSKKINLISFIESNFGVKIPKTANYDRISEILEENSIGLYEDVLGVDSPIEVAHLYSFYKALTNIFWETTWIKSFSPFYNFLFGEEIKIRKKSELRKYAAEVITKFSQNELIRKWVEYTSSKAYTAGFSYLFNQPTPVIHYEHLTIGPLGFLFSLHYREKEIFRSNEPILAILVNTTHTGEDIIDWERTDAFKVFSFLLEELNKKINEVTSNYPVYGDYLALIDFEFPYEDFKRELLNFIKFFKEQLKEDKIPLMFYQIVQLSGLFFMDEEVIDLLNKLIADNTLIINSETEIEDLKVTKNGIIKRPKSWLARPAFELATDIADILSIELASEDFRKLLIDILQTGAVRYLERIFDDDFETFKNICVKRSLHKFASLDKPNITKENAIRLILETYGLQTPSTSSLGVRTDIISFLEEVKDFKENYKELADSSLIKKIIDILRDGRTYLERILEEWLFIIISLVLHYEDSVSKGIPKYVFLLDRPLFHIWYYNKEQELKKIREKYQEFLGKLTHVEGISDELRKKINNYKKGRIEFTLGDWYSLLKLSMNYIENNLTDDFWNALPPHFSESVNLAVSEMKRFLIKEKALKSLNLASHAKAMIELRESIEDRKEALSILLKLDTIVPLLLQNLPELVVITEKVTEAKTGLEYYVAESTGDRSIKIYGTRFIELQFLYYIIPRFEEEEDIVTYPILITNLTDIVF